MILSKLFYARDSAAVARGLLGKILVHKTKAGILKGKIVETEAYYGAEDPASRAYKKKRGKAGMAEQMFREVGTAFTYMVHANWLFNVIGKNIEAGGVLIRALEPLEGIELMFKNRKLPDSKKGNVLELCSGPGKLSKAFAFTKADSGIDLTKAKKIWIEDPQIKNKFEVATSHRIGVTKDLPQKLRFYIKGSQFVSKNKT